MNIETIKLWVLLAYIAWATFYGIQLVRPKLMNWYESQMWMTSGAGAVDIFLKGIGRRISWEIFVLMLSVLVGAMGGAVYMAFIKKNEIQN